MQKQMHAVGCMGKYPKYFFQGKVCFGLYLWKFSSLQVCEDLDGVECPCSGDDWECYKPAQLQFLNAISRAPGCIILLTGGLEYSDIKV
jgi:hypothetical protein